MRVHNFRYLLKNKVFCFIIFLFYIFCLLTYNLRVLCINKKKDWLWDIFNFITLLFLIIIFVM